MRVMLYLWFCAMTFAASAAEDWQSALRQMPLGTSVAELNRTNCVKIMLNAFQSNSVVKALIFMPGATDEFYMFRRAGAKLTNAAPSLLDAVEALTNQTLIRATFRPPLLLLHTDEDPLDPLSEIKHTETANKIRQTQFVSHVVYNDRDWDFLLPILKKKLHARFSPKMYSRDSWHFYRHSFAAWNLNGWEALQSIALAGKTKFTVDKKMVIFEGDERTLVEPHLDSYPK